MKIVIDGDSCPVVNIISDIALKYEIKVLLIASINHISKKPLSIDVIYVDSEFQSADIAIVNRVNKGDIVVTNDYGLASLVIEKGCKCVSANGNIIDSRNIDILLMDRYTVMKLKKGGYRIKGPKKRTKEKDDVFRASLISIIKESLNI